MMNHGRSAALRSWRIAPTSTSALAATVRRVVSSDKDTSSRSIEKIDPRMTEWIRPDRPLVGDKGYSHLYNNEEEKKPTEEEELAQIEREVQLLEEEVNLTEEEQLQRIEQELKILEAADAKTKKKRKRPVVVQPRQTLDWMKTRREALNGGTLTPSFGRPQQDLEAKHHTLLTATEILEFLSSLGGIDPNLIKDQAYNEHGDTRLGGAFHGIIFVTGTSTAHIRMLASSLVEQLKRRKLEDVGVNGARFGAEGMDDEDSNWMCLDCGNYVVNIQDAATRKMMDLEDWWSKADPLEEYNLQGTEQDDEALDEFCLRNPVPPDYGRSGLADWDTNNSIHQLENKKWTAPHRAVVPKPRTGRSRRKMKKRR